MNTTETKDETIRRFANQILSLQNQLQQTKTMLIMANDFLRKYQERYHGTEHAKKLWDAVDKYLKQDFRMPFLTVQSPAAEYTAALVKRASPPE